MKDHIDLKCNGFLINVYPSPIMKFVAKAYFLQPGKQAKMDSSANIYEYTDITKIISPEKQDLFDGDWIKSLKHNSDHLSVLFINPDFISGRSATGAIVS